MKYFNEEALKGTKIEQLEGLKERLLASFAPSDKFFEEIIGELNGIIEAAKKAEANEEDNQKLREAIASTSEIDRIVKHFVLLNGELTNKIAPVTGGHREWAHEVQPHSGGKILVHYTVDIQQC